jgi:hypothetical protein
MQDDPDEVLKTKGEKLGEIDDPDELLKVNELYKKRERSRNLIDLKGDTCRMGS